MFCQNLDVKYFLQDFFIQYSGLSFRNKQRRKGKTEKKCTAGFRLVNASTNKQKKEFSTLLYTDDNTKKQILQIICCNISRRVKDLAQSHNFGTIL